MNSVMNKKHQKTVNLRKAVGELTELRNKVKNPKRFKESHKEGIKNDSNKLRLDLLPIEPLEDIAKVLTFGANKYEDWNWAKGFKYSRLVGALLRHVFAWIKGNDLDPESGESHLAHAGCCILFLLWHIKNKPELDDRKV